VKVAPVYSISISSLVAKQIAVWPGKKGAIKASSTFNMWNNDPRIVLHGWDGKAVHEDLLVGTDAAPRKGCMAITVDGPQTDITSS